MPRRRGDRPGAADPLLFLNPPAPGARAPCKTGAPTGTCASSDGSISPPGPAPLGQVKPADDQTFTGSLRQCRAVRELARWAGRDLGALAISLSFAAEPQFVD